MRPALAVLALALLGCPSSQLVVNVSQYQGDLALDPRLQQAQLASTAKAGLGSLVAALEELSRFRMQLYRKNLLPPEFKLFSRTFTLPDTVRADELGVKDWKIRQIQFFLWDTINVGLRRFSPAQGEAENARLLLIDLLRKLVLHIIQHPDESELREFEEQIRNVEATMKSTFPAFAQAMTLPRRTPETLPPAPFGARPDEVLSNWLAERAADRAERALEGETAKALHEHLQKIPAPSGLGGTVYRILSTYAEKKDREAKARVVDAAGRLEEARKHCTEAELERGKIDRALQIGEALGKARHQEKRSKEMLEGAAIGETAELRRDHEAFRAKRTALESSLPGASLREPRRSYIDSLLLLIHDRDKVARSDVFLALQALALDLSVPPPVQEGYGVDADFVSRLVDWSEQLKALKLQMESADPDGADWVRAVLTRNLRDYERERKTVGPAELRPWDEWVASSLAETRARLAGDDLATVENRLLYRRHDPERDKERADTLRAYYQTLFYPTWTAIEETYLRLTGLGNLLLSEDRRIARWNGRQLANGEQEQAKNLGEAQTQVIAQMIADLKGSLVPEWKNPGEPPKANQAAMIRKANDLLRDLRKMHHAYVDLRPIGAYLALDDIWQAIKGKNHPGFDLRLNWRTITTVRVEAGANANYVVMKDHLGNWQVKSASNDPSELINAAFGGAYTVLEILAKQAGGVVGPVLKDNYDKFLASRLDDSAADPLAMKEYATLLKKAVEAQSAEFEKAAEGDQKDDAFKTRADALRRYLDDLTRMSQALQSSKD